MGLNYDAIGRQVKAFRIASGLSADEIAQRMGISRSVLYRVERGELTKLDTLETIADLLDVSLPSLLGVGIAYWPSAATYFERLLEFEKTAREITMLAGPISFLLATPKYVNEVAEVLAEGVPPTHPDRNGLLRDVEQVLCIQHARRQTYAQRNPRIVKLISVVQVERFLTDGLITEQTLPESVKVRRRGVARREIEHLCHLISADSNDVQIGLVQENPHNGFQIYRDGRGSTITVSPFRLGEQPNIRVGVAITTSAPEAVALHEKIIMEAWPGAIKGAAAIRLLEQKLG